MTSLPIAADFQGVLEQDRSHRIRRAIDPQNLLNGLCRHWPAQRGSTLRAVEVERVHRKQNGFVIHLTVMVQSSGGTWSENLLAEYVDDPEAHCASVLRKLAKTHRGQGQASKHRVFAVPELSLVVRAEGLDEALPALRLLYDSESASDALRRMGIEGELLNRRPIFAHRLGKRCVAMFEFQNRAPVVGKFSRATHEKGAVVHRWSEAIAAQLAETGVRVPPPLGFDPELGLSLSLAIGNPHHDPLSMPGSSHRAGEALRLLHGIDLALPTRHDVEKEVGVLDGAANLAAALRPEFSDTIRSACAVVSDRLRRTASCGDVRCHRDFHPKQVLLGTGGAFLIDFDTLSMADAALDVGNYLAHLRFAGMVAGQSVAAQEAEFLEGYRIRLSPDAVGAWCRVSLARIACIHAPTSRYAHFVPRLFAEALS